MTRGKKSKLWLQILCCTIILVLLAGISILFLRSRINSPLQVINNQSKNLDFTVYSPEILPKNYVINSSSIRSENNILFYDLNNGSKTISISEQKLPDQPPDLNGLKGFKKITTLAGDAALGNEAGRPIGILITNSSLVSLSGSPSVDLDVVAKTLQSMRSDP